MAHKGIREYDADRLMAKGLEKYSGGKIKFDLPFLRVSPKTDLSKLPGKHPWLHERQLVVKPDQLFGKRGKNKLILLDAEWSEAKEWIIEKRDNEVSIEQGRGRLTGKLTDFLVEPFVRHDLEFYIAITAERDHDIIHFSTEGGMDVEDNWDKVTSIEVPLMDGISGMDIEGMLPTKMPCRKETVGSFIRALYQFFADLHLTYLELNPFTLEGDKVVPLDAVVKVDDTAGYQCADAWGDLDFPTSFGMCYSKEEERVAQLDAQTGASLKLTVLNAGARIWTMIAGGGASVIFADTVVDLGHGDELANYGEYSGNPSTQDTYEYARVILEMMTREPDPEGKPKILIIGGGIANFTDVAKTFTGLAKAITEMADQLKAVDARIWIRRGGPNYKEGLDRMRRLGEEVGIPIEVHGPEMHMTRVVKMALEEEVA